MNKTLIAYRGSRIEEWHKVYCETLAQAVVANPKDYGAENLTLDEVAKFSVNIANKARHTLKTRGVGRIQINSAGWQRAARRFSIPNTYRAWEDFFSGK